jgi:hypothetical protein
MSKKKINSTIYFYRLHKVIGPSLFPSACQAEKPLIEENSLELAQG